MPSSPPYPVPPIAKPASHDPVRRALWFGRPSRALALATGPDADLVRGIALLALGRYNESGALLVPLMAAGPLRAAAGAAYASGLRQRQKYRAARDVDTAALAAAGTDEDRADALVGLVADAIGCSDPDTATALVTSLDALLPTAGWRAPIRRAWVTCELALATERPADAETAAHRALVLARQAQARRHIAKSLLFLGVSRREAARLGPDRPRYLSAAAILRVAEHLARSVEAQPLVAVARSVHREIVREIAAGSTVA